jgi:hypothetical protein
MGTNSVKCYCPEWKVRRKIALLERELTEARNLLSDIHDFLLDQEDADCVDGVFVPNQAMRFVQEIDAALANVSGTLPENAQDK